MIIELNFEKISYTVKSTTAKPVNLSETSGDTAGIHQRAADPPQSVYCQRPPTLDELCE